MSMTSSHSNQRLLSRRLPMFLRAGIMCSLFLQTARAAVRVTIAKGTLRGTKENPRFTPATGTKKDKYFNDWDGGDTCKLGGFTPGAVGSTNDNLVFYVSYYSVGQTVRTASFGDMLWGGKISNTGFKIYTKIHPIQAMGFGLGVFSKVCEITFRSNGDFTGLPDFKTCMDEMEDTIRAAGTLNDNRKKVTEFESQRENHIRATNEAIRRESKRVTSYSKSFDNIYGSDNRGRCSDGKSTWYDTGFGEPYWEWNGKHKKRDECVNDTQSKCTWEGNPMNTERDRIRDEARVTTKRMKSALESFKRDTKTLLATLNGSVTEAGARNRTKKGYQGKFDKTCADLRGKMPKLRKRRRLVFIPSKHNRVFARFCEENATELGL